MAALLGPTSIGITSVMAAHPNYYPVAYKGWVVRGGYGMSYYAQDYAAGSLNLTNPPFNVIESAPAGQDSSAGRANGAGALPIQR